VGFDGHGRRRFISTVMTGGRNRRAESTGTLKGRVIMQSSNDSHMTPDSALESCHPPHYLIAALRHKLKLLAIPPPSPH
jgi:hypothetical protein